MKTTSSITSLAFSLVGLLMVGSTADAQSIHHLNEMTSLAHQQARAVWADTSGIYHHAPDLRSLRTDALRMALVARRLSTTTHIAAGRRVPLRGHAAHYELERIKRDVSLLDRLMHQMQDEITEKLLRLEMQSSARPVPRPTGTHFQTGYGYRPYTSVGNNSFSFAPGCSLAPRYGNHYTFGAGSPTRMLRRMEADLAELEATVHHLIADTSATCFRA